MDKGKRAVRIIAWIDTASDTGQFVPYATGMAEALQAELTLIRGARADTELCDAGDADLLLVPDSRVFALPIPWPIRPVRRMLHVRRTPVCVVPLETIKRHGRFQPDPIVCEVELDGTDGNLLNEACSLSSRTDALLHLVYTVPESGEQLLAQGVDGSDGPPLTHGEALRRMNELCTAIPVAHTAQILTRPCALTGASGLLITPPAKAISRLREGLHIPVLSVRPDARRRTRRFWSNEPMINVSAGSRA